MESYESLQERKNQLENESKAITIKKHGSTPWRPGVQDQYKSESYSYDEYTDVSKAYKLKEQIAYVDHLMKTYGQRVKEQQAMEAALRESEIPKYSYEIAGKQEETKNPAIAARYDAQHRLHGMSKLKQTIAKVTGQQRKFKKLWLQAATDNKKTQEEVAMEINKMFR